MLKRIKRLEQRSIVQEQYETDSLSELRERVDKKYRSDLRKVNSFIGSEINRLVKRRWQIVYELDLGRNKKLFQEKKSITSKIDRLYDLRDLINRCCKKFIAISRINKSSVRESYSLPLYCGSMLCPKCSEHKSKIHNRKVYRIAKWLLLIRDKFGNKPPLHSIVFTLPLALRPYFKLEKMLNVLFKAANVALKNVVGPEGSIMSMHFYGDKSEKYNPHLNVTFGGISSVDRLPLPKIIPKAELKELRECFLGEVLRNVPGLAKDELFGVDDANGTRFIEQNSNCHRSIRVQKGEKLHNLIYIFRSTLPLEKLAASSQEIKDMFLYDLSPCKSGVNGRSNRGSGYRNIRYFGAYRCSNRKKYLEENNIVIADNPGFKTTDDDIEFVVIKYGDGKPRLFNYDDDNVVVGAIHPELKMPQVFLDLDDDH